MNELTHTQAQNLIQATMGGRLSPSERESLHAHLEACAACRAYQRQMTALESGLRQAMHARWDNQGQPSPSIAEQVYTKGRAYTMFKNRLSIAVPAISVIALVFLFIFAISLRPQPAAPPAGESTGQVTETAGITLPADPIPAIPKSMKGYELYSWQAGDQWYFTLITGTNRNKTFEEITAEENTITGEGWVKITVQGVEAIKTILSKVPAQEYIFWISAPGLGPAPSDAHLDLPPQEMVEDIQQHCRLLGLNLQVAGETGAATSTPEALPTQAETSEPVRLPSPNGQWTAILYRDTGSLVLEDARGAQHTVFPEGSTVSSVRWSADSSRLAVALSHIVRPVRSPDDIGMAEIWLVTVTDSGLIQPQRLRAPGPSDEDAGAWITFGAWSPDGSRLLYWVGSLSASIQADGLPLWSLEVETGSATRLSETALVNPSYQSWAPDGSALVFTDGGYRSAQVNKRLSLYDVESGQTRSILARSEFVPGAVAWSPAGDIIAFAAVRSSQTGDEWADYMGWDNPAIQARRIYLLDPQAGEYRRLNAAEAYQDAPRWGAGGETIYYVQIDGDQAVLMQADPATGEAHALPGCRAPLPSGAGYYGLVDWKDLYENCPEMSEHVVKHDPSGENWLAYTSKDGRYAFRYPGDAEIHTEGVVAFPTGELPEDMTPAAYIDQLKKQYPGDLCVSVGYKIGFIAIQLPEGGKYGPPCGVTGVGDFEIKTRTEDLVIGSQSLQAQKFELYERTSGGQKPLFLAEFYMIELPDGIQIHLGGFWADQGAYIRIIRRLKAHF